jgi:hypothetical protein
MYSPEDGLPVPRCINCKYKNANYVHPCSYPDILKIDARFGGANCEAHEYKTPDEPGDYVKGE